MAEPLVIQRLAKKRAFQDFKASKSAWTQVDEWCEEACAIYGVDAAKLRRWIIDESQNELSLARLESMTEAQRTAQIVGATLPKALEALVAGLSAMRVKVRVDKDGQELGRIETPDNEARISASKEILRVLGAYAPEKLELFDGQMEEFKNLTEEQLDKELARLRKIKGDSNSPGNDRPAGGKELLLLADAGDADERRARSAESLQAIPSKAVFPTDFTGSRQ